MLGELDPNRFVPNSLQWVDPLELSCNDGKNIFESANKFLVDHRAGIANVANKLSRVNPVGAFGIGAGYESTLGLSEFLLDPYGNISNAFNGAKGLTSDFVDATFKGDFAAKSRLGETGLAMWEGGKEWASETIDHAITGDMFELGANTGSHVIDLTTGVKAGLKLATLKVPHGTVSMNGAGDHIRRAVDVDVVKITEKFGTNEAIWKLDAQGRPLSVEAKLDTTYHETRSSAEKKFQSEVGGGARLDSDDGGHLIGHRFMSDQGEKNLFPQNANLNRSGYKKMENEWADWTAEGFEVKLKVELDPPSADRPDNIISEYQVIDPKTGKVVYEKEHRFMNQAGEVFERVSKKDMKNYKVGS
ncbi:DNA/RNA non-specific endonuclease [Photobacterium nomapromontoriensis]|uniref:DNA/RNA non-specific endonuclease n=1 Tax=Photobacterium nomapromontoriensis TaxID=2910237 RepID=UPI003D114322